ncbi:MAG: Cytochrome d ubiquinol oxidase subunit [Pseudonocardia sp.]|uniref:cytochrome d ubiquinol oxidase subunit II n=1 Tax=Pseudonocardia sp. TaxID=60912 RepID=UPI0026391719|nr:cytochrome d ubiquinol oxidase subunit II [Pseudonocardia sp.]MCU1629939.1 Cytochrome d ubiquinol oxidase subunit [Pseudonocardia sp.]MDT7703915.1 cytochrome bd ubiquinol oxidase subunit [Pseudonocardiales bacterium]
MSPPPELIAVAVVLLAVIAAYALFSGADFGGGIWDLLAGGTRRGAVPRAAIDASVTPVWEGNHVWIIFGLVIMWTAFPPAFAAIMTALFTPLALSLLGIFLRGVGFAFRHEAERLNMQRLNGALFAASSLMAPFFLGTVIGAVATGAVPAAPFGQVLSAWTSPTALVTGALFVATCAYIAAIYLVADSERRKQPEMVRYFSHRAIAAGVLSGVLAAVNLLLMRTSSPYIFDRLIGPALPLVVVSVVAGIAALVLVVLRRVQLMRIAAGLAVAAVVAGWGWAQYPWLLPGSLTLQAGSAPSAALWAELAVTGLAVLFVLPAFAWLYWLQQHGRLQETTDDVRLAAAAASPVEATAAPTPSPASVQSEHRVVAAVLIASVAAGLARQALEHWRSRRR